MADKTAPETPRSIDTMDAAALRKTAWSSVYKRDSVRPSIFAPELKTEFEVMGTNIIIPTKNGIILDVSNIGNKDMAQTVRLALRKPLKKAPRQGVSEDMLGNEESSDYLYFTAAYNEIKKAVSMYGYGYYHNDTKYLNHNAGYSALMGSFHAEWEDHRFQSALLLMYSPELTKTPVSYSQKFNKNWAIPNLASTSYPSWDVVTIPYNSSGSLIDSNGYYSSAEYGGTGGDFVENIGEALESAGGTSSTSTGTLTVDSMSEITTWIVDQHKVEPIMLDGMASYIWKMPSRVYDWISNPNNTGTLGSYWQSVKQYKDETRIQLPGEVGRFKNFVICLDPRCPTITSAGSAGARTITPGFIYPGNYDMRNNNAWSATSGSTNYVWDMTQILGANSVVRYTKDKLDMDLSETNEYGKILGKGSYKGCGILLPLYDQGTPTATSGIYRGSCCVPVSRISNI